MTSGGAPAADATVTFTMTNAGGRKVTGSATTSATGSANWSYKVGSKDPAGTWSVTSSATPGLASATSNTVTFSVQ